MDMLTHLTKQAMLQRAQSLRTVATDTNDTDTKVFVYGQIEELRHWAQWLLGDEFASKVAET